MRLSIHLVMQVAFVAALAVPVQSNPLSGQGCADINTQSGMTKCAATQLGQADAAMTATYNNLRRKLGLKSSEAARLRDAQRAWISYRDAWCRFQTMSVEQGSMYPQVLASCTEALTKEQTKRLTYQLTCSGDVDCPGPL